MEKMAQDVQFLIVTGMSGAGKTLALKVLEDQGVFCIDNLPPAFVTKLYELSQQGGGNMQRIAVVMDIRGGVFFDDLFTQLQNMEEQGYGYEILFLEASDDILVRRYKETRRRHPLAPEGRILDGIHAEREKLEAVRGRASRILDTTKLSREQLQTSLCEQFFSRGEGRRMVINLISFGYKYGLPMDADIVMDVRFLPNPHYVPSLQPFHGEDPEVQAYVLKWPLARRFMDRFFRLIQFLVPHYASEGKAHLSIAIGCTGGRHRSVVMVEKLHQSLSGKGFQLKVEHRDKLRSGF